MKLTKPIFPVPPKTESNKIKMVTEIHPTVCLGFKRQGKIPEHLSARLLARNVLTVVPASAKTNATRHLAKKRVSHWHRNFVVSCPDPAQGCSLFH